jgi:hypothetical protein
LIYKVNHDYVPNPINIPNHQANQTTNPSNTANFTVNTPRSSNKS